MLVNEETLLKLCKDNGLEAFETMDGLDWDTDLILNSDDIDEVFRLCKGYNEKVIFYSYNLDMDDEISSDNIEEKIRNAVKNKTEQYTNNWFGINLVNYSDIDVLIDKHLEDIQYLSVNLDTEEHKINSITLDVFISHAGDRMGVSICVESEENNNKISNTEHSFENLVNTIVSEVETLHNQRVCEREAERNREREEIEKQYNSAIKEIKEEVANSNRLLECTNGKLRHAYARDLANKYADKYDIRITIGEVDGIVDLEYKKRK